MKSVSHQELRSLIRRESRTMLLKGTVLGIVLMTFTRVLNTHAYTIDTSFENAVQYIKSIFVTDNGKSNGNLLVAMNTGSKSLLVNGSTSFVGDVSISGTLHADLNELDPKVGTVTSGKTCFGNSGKVECTTTLPENPRKTGVNLTYYTGKVGI